MHDLEMHLTWRSIRLFGSFDPKEMQHNYLEKKTQKEHCTIHMRLVDKVID
jgi:hypothetical protein